MSAIKAMRRSKRGATSGAWSLRVRTRPRTRRPSSQTKRLRGGRRHLGFAGKSSEEIYPIFADNGWEAIWGISKPTIAMIDGLPLAVDAGGGRLRPSHRGDHRHP